MRSLLRFLAGVVLPLALIVVVAQLLRPATVEEPPPPSLEVDEATAPPTEAPTGGTWRVVAEESFVGYRIEERDPTRGARTNEAVGRTSAVDGGVTVVDGVVEEATVTAHLTDLESAEPRRDQSIRRRYLESFEHRRARFELISPVALDAPGDEFVVESQVEGRLELRGHTSDLTVDVKARWDERSARVVGRGRVVLEDYDITPPRIAGFRFVADEGDVEFDLTLRR